ncbi:hypothetical protein O181_015125 [Austropuccinia psidii MF-1]|uniref:Uncharacterized protein n=1 Tax=Austropuccinia psidii MF-1 TaxID=1389203 RepID=A0A9Q3C398_9BASI|nr:hypothetical protein [Austropuccinia psidii MF-1]
MEKIVYLLGLVPFWDFNLCSLPIDQAQTAGREEATLIDSMTKSAQNNSQAMTEVSAPNHPFVTVDDSPSRYHGSILSESWKTKAARSPRNLRKRPREAPLEQKYYQRKRKKNINQVYEASSVHDKSDDIALYLHGQTSTSSYHKRTSNGANWSTTFSQQSAKGQTNHSKSLTARQKKLKGKKLTSNEKSIALSHETMKLLQKMESSPRALPVIFSSSDKRHFTITETDLYYAYMSVLSYQTTHFQSICGSSNVISVEILQTLKSIGGDHGITPKVLKNLQDLQNNMISINFNIARIFSPHIKKSVIKIEQEALQGVFNKVFGSTAMSLAIINADKESSVKDSLKLTKFEQLVEEYFNLPEKEDSWIVRNCFAGRTDFPVLRSQRLQTEIILTLMRAYYQFISPQKWKQLFDTDQGFLKFMLNLAQLYKNNNFNQKDYLVVRELRKLSPLFPWISQSKLHQNVLRIEKKILQPNKFLRKNWLERWVDHTFEPIPLQLPVTSTQVISQSQIDLTQLGPKVYEFFDRLANEALSNGANELIEKNVKEFMNNFSQNVVTPFKLFGTYIGSSVIDDQARSSFEDQTRRFLGVLWFINKQFLEIFGCESTSPAYQEAQQELLEWVRKNELKNILDKKKLDLSHEFQSEIRLKNSADDSGSSHGTATTIEGAEKIEDLTITNQEMVKSVIETLSFYYHSMNPFKFEALYSNNEDFLKSLLAFKEYWGQEVSAAMKVFKIFLSDELKVLPWKEKVHFFLDIEKLESSLRLTFFKSCYHRQRLL